MMFDSGDTAWSQPGAAVESAACAAQESETPDQRTMIHPAIRRCHSIGAYNDAASPSARAAVSPKAQSAERNQAPRSTAPVSALKSAGGTAAVQRSSASTS